VKYITKFKRKISITRCIISIYNRKYNSNSFHITIHCLLRCECIVSIKQWICMHKNKYATR